MGEKNRFFYIYERQNDKIDSGSIKWGSNTSLFLIFLLCCFIEKQSAIFCRSAICREDRLVS